MFLKYLADERKLSASSVNHHRTILNGIFNFAVRRGKYDQNPVAAVRQRQEPPGRDRIVTPDEFRALWESAKAMCRCGPSWRSRALRRCVKARSCRCVGKTYSLVIGRPLNSFGPRQDTSGMFRYRLRSSRRSRLFRHERPANTSSVGRQNLIAHTAS